MAWIRCLLYSLFAMTLITGCVRVDLPTQPSPLAYKKQSWAQRHHALMQLHHWNIDGAFSVQRPDKSVIANYTWQQAGNDFSIHISSSLDAYSALIRGEPGHVTLWRSDRQSFSANNPEQLMQQQLGWSLPLSNLFYWIRGLPAPGKYQARYDHFGHVIALWQRGWQVQFSNYWPLGNVDVPRTLLLNHAHLTAKIVIKHWIFLSL